MRKTEVLPKTIVFGQTNNSHLHFNVAQIKLNQQITDAF